MATLSLSLVHPQALPLWRQGLRQRRLHGSFSCQSRHAHAAGRVQASYRGLEPLYDDGYGTVNDLGHYYKAIGELVEHDGGPPRWLCPVDAGEPAVEDAPVMLYLPGIDGMGMGLCMHHKALGTIFELRCMHIPLRDRTPFEELVTMVEDVVRAEHSASPTKPIYILGNSFGGCIALAVAARNPGTDLVLVLVNPATSFERSRIKTLLSVFSPLSDRVCIAAAALLNYNTHNEVNMALSIMKSGRHPLEALSRLTSNMSSSLKHSKMLDKLPKDTLKWKIKLIKQAASYANSHIESVTAEVLLLASCADRLLPSKSEANRLQKKLPKCRVFFFEKHGHSLLLVSFFKQTLSALLNLQLLWTYDDIRSVPFGGKLLRAYSNHLKLRDTQEVIFPGAVPKIPGRFYYRFGKPIPTRGRQDVLTDRRAATELYFDVKSEVEEIIAYLLEKREEDRYRSILPRLLYRAVRGSKTEVPAFNP
uniref:Serine aminopeptidase S33 domain-containing protein n=1 Tax=Triticum urartu TaxID=4572 RepID=A0A8R7QXE3_TRIUA